MKFPSSCRNKSYGFSLKIIFCWTLGLSLFSCNQIPDPRLFQNNNQGIESLLSQNYLSAKDSFIRSLEYSPFQSEVLLNLGLSFQMMQDPEKALITYQKVDEISRDPAAQFSARFNKGLIHQVKNEVDLALFEYQKALNIKPDSVEVKTNIELLIQKQKNQSQSEQGDSGQSSQDSKNKSDKNKSDKNQKDQQDSDKSKDQNKDKESDKNKDQGQGSEKDQKQKDSKDPYKQNAKYKPREFKGELSQSDVNKILGELKNQEQKIRGNYYKSETKDKPRDKDW